MHSHSCRRSRAEKRETQRGLKRLSTKTIGPHATRPIAIGWTAHTQLVRRVSSRTTSVPCAVYEAAQERCDRCRRRIHRCGACCTAFVPSSLVLSTVLHRCAAIALHSTPLFPVSSSSCSLAWLRFSLLSVQNAAARYRTHARAQPCLNPCWP